MNTNPAPPTSSTIQLPVTSFSGKTIGGVEKRLDTEMNKSKAALTIPEGKRGSLESPINRLPPEILAEIFRESCIDEEWPLEPDLNAFSVVLSVVCSHWWEVATTTAALWSTIILQISDWPSSTHDKLFRTVQLFVSRSKQHPLKISLDFFTGPAAELVVQNCDRWSSVDLRFKGPTFPHLLGDIHGRLPLLERLKVDCDDDSSLRSHLINIFSHAPALHSLELVCCATSTRWNLPWHQIRHVRVVRCVEADIYSVLPLLRNANEIVIEGLESDRVGPGLDTPSLGARSVSIGVGDYGDENHLILDRFFNAWTFPSLDTLRVVDRHHRLAGRKSWDVAPLRECLLRSSCTGFLSSLHIGGLRIPDVQMISVLELTPSLRSLTIVDYGHREVN
ncbi:hypothetical protein V5O48_012820, partial [Marasmius crinis-equi]